MNKFIASPSASSIKGFLRCRRRRSRRRSRHGFIFLPRGRQACPIGGDEIPFPQTAKGLVAEDVGIGVEVGEEDVH